LIRALIDIGGLSISAAKQLLAVLDSANLDAWESVGKVQYALGRRRTAPPEGEPDEAATRTVEELLARSGRRIRPNCPARHALIDACAALQRLGHNDIVAALDGYAAAIEPIAAIDIDVLTHQSSIPHDRNSYRRDRPRRQPALSPAPTRPRTHLATAAAPTGAEKVLKR